jgi:hypothetical protein
MAAVGWVMIVDVGVGLGSATSKKSTVLDGDNVWTELKRNGHGRPRHHRRPGLGWNINIPTVDFEMTRSVSWRQTRS